MIAISPFSRDSNLDGAGIIGETIRLVNNDFAYAFKISTLSTTGGEEIKISKHVGHTSTMMRILIEENGDLQSNFKKTDKSQKGTKELSLNQILIDNHKRVADRGKVKGQQSLRVFIRVL